MAKVRDEITGVIPYLWPGSTDSKRQPQTYRIKCESKVSGTVHVHAGDSSHPSVAVTAPSHAPKKESLKRRALPSPSKGDIPSGSFQAKDTGLQAGLRSRGHIESGMAAGGPVHGRNQVIKPLDALSHIRDPKESYQEDPLEGRPRALRSNRTGPRPTKRSSGCWSVSL